MPTPPHSSTSSASHDLPKPTASSFVPHDSEGHIEASTNDSSQSLSFSARLEHFTWAWFTLPMSTGGLALLLSPQTQPHTFSGLEAIGKTVYIIDLVIFLACTACISYRFLRYRGTLTASLTHPTESLFSATFFLSLASIIAAIARYGTPSLAPENQGWLIYAYRVLFWAYFSCTFLSAVGQYCLLFTSPALKISDMTPAWDLPIFPFMLSGTIAATGAGMQPPSRAVPMIVAGVMAQGLGFLVSILMYASYIRRMVQFGFPGAPARPAMFIAVGPPSFTSLALVGMASAWPRDGYIDYFGAPLDASGLGLSDSQKQLVAYEVLRDLGNGHGGVHMESYAWFFCIAVIANVAVASEMRFHLNWWAFVFPNVGFVIAAITIGKVLESQAVLWVGSVATVLLICVYLFVAVMHIRAVWNRNILWPGKDEDVYRRVIQTKKIREEEKNKRADQIGDVEKQD